MCTSCRPLGIGEAAGLAAARAEKRRRRRRGSWPGLRAGTPSLTHLLLPLPSPSLSCLSSLRPLDIEFLQRLCRTVNVVPVIARADSLTIEERENFRQRVIWVPGARMELVGVGRGQSAEVELRLPACGPQIQHNLRTHCIDVYPQKCFDEDINDRILNGKIRVGGRGGQGG